MPLLSIVINLDTRPERGENEKMFNGVVSRDFLVDGIENKRKFFNGFDVEVIVFVDEHEPLDENTIRDMRGLCDALIIRKHNKRFEGDDNYTAFNDLNYLQALFMARGEYIFHFDGDVAAFTSSPEQIQRHIDWLEQYDYVSYPSRCSPNPVHDESFGGKFWVSTRFFCCKRSTINISEVLKCQLDYDYWKATYPIPRLCHWTEHLLSSISWHTGKGVYYPPMDVEKYAIFTWGSYEKWTLRRLNLLPYDEIKQFIRSKGNIQYPCDIRC